MSCALANPEAGACANRRPVRGRTRKPAAPAQPPLIPLAEGHSRLRPFSEAAPEATFSLTAVREPELVAAPSADVATDMPQPDVLQPLRSTPPSFREIRAGRAVAAARAPIAEARIPLADLDDAQTRMAFTNVDGAGLDELVERVRRRTAARLSGR
jgi:hypothetical protein